MNPRLEGQQEIYQALVVASNAATKAMVKTIEIWREILEAYETKTRPIYSQNADLTMQAKAEAGKEFVKPTNIGSNVDVGFANLAADLNKQTTKLEKRNHDIQDILVKLNFLGRANLSPAVALRIKEGQDQIIDLSLKVNEVALEAQKLFQTQAMLSGDSKNVTPQQKQQLEAKIKEFTDLNKQFKDQIKKQAKAVSEVKSEVENQPPRAKL